MKSPAHLFFGYGELTLPSVQAACFLNLCRERSLPYTLLSCPGKETPLRVRMRLRDARFFLALCRERGIDATLSRVGGLPRLFRVLGAHCGLLVGVLLGGALLFFSGKVVWDIRVDVGDAQSITSKEVEAVLSEAGLRRGSWIPALDGEAIEAALLQSDAPIAWASVNLTGTVAEVQIVELVAVAPAHTDGLSNVVAARDGIIEEVRLVEGRVLVRTGQFVRAGTLLIAGMEEDETTGTRLYAADGHVLARTERSFSVTVPYETTVPEPDGAESWDISLLFFGKSIKIFKNSGNLPPICDTIEENEKVRIFSLGEGLSLPFGYVLHTCQPMRESTVRRSPEEAEAEARAALEAHLTALCGEAQLLSARTVIETGEDALTLTATLTLSEDIAVRVPVETDGATKK